jgi:uncharacterized protein with PQ loop repeat
MNINLTETVGLCATLFVLLSFLYKEPIKIRAVNLIGAVLFTAYGLLTDALSVWLLNCILIIIQIYNIIKLRACNETSACGDLKHENFSCRRKYEKMHYSGRARRN